MIGIGIGVQFCTSSGGGGLSNPTGGPFAINIVIGTGQSLSVGEQSTTSLDETQPYDNVMLGGGELVPAICPVRAVGGSGVYPGNLGGPQTVAVPFANQLTELLGWRCAVVEVGESGHDMSWIKKGGTGAAYAGTLAEVQTIYDLATEAGLTCGVVAVLLTHGQGDHASITYTAEVQQLRNDYQADLSAITGQTFPIVMVAAQQATHNTPIAPSRSTLTPWQLVESYPTLFVATPIYQLPYFSDGVHMESAGYHRMGIEYALAYAAHLAGETSALRPLSATLDEDIITVDFEVPVEPLTWSLTLPDPHPATAAWSAGKGFEVTTAAGDPVTITGVEIVGTAVVIECATPPGAAASVHYARYQDATGYNGGKAAGRRGLLCDSRTATDYAGGGAAPNFALQFTLPL